MRKLIVDRRIDFKLPPVTTGSSAVLSASVTGGPWIWLQVGLFDGNDRLIGGIGNDAQSNLVDSIANGTASWRFTVPADIAYLKWGVTAFRSAGSQPRYEVTTLLTDGAGNLLATSRFANRIPDGADNDDVVVDGIDIVR